MDRRKALKSKNTKKIFIIMLTLFFVMHFGEYFVKNYAYRWLGDEGVDREMKLTYLGALDVDISLSDVFSQDAESYDEYTNCWQISDLKDYNYFRIIGNVGIGLNLHLMRQTIVQMLYMCIRQTESEWAISCI